MSNRELPILNFEPFREYPTKRNQQELDDDRQACSGCLSGVCCSTEDPIALTSFDIYRLAAFFNMSPAEFMLTFTQDKFDGEDSDYRRERIDNPNSSVVTWLRRRANFWASPCIFLKYVREPDGTPRRICSVHDARPLSCREFYFDTCKLRVTGELASLLAEGFEKVRDKEITDELVDAMLARFGAHNVNTSTLAENMEYYFWVEMKCVVNMDAANVEGSNSYNMAEYQDSIDEKLNRALSAKYLRFEEGYGPKPHDEQLMPYTSGLNFSGSTEYERIMKVARTRPSSGFFALGNYQNYVGLRTMVPGVKYAHLFPVIPDAEIDSFLSSIPPTRLFPNHELQNVRSITLQDVYVSVLKAFNHLIRFSSHVVTMEPVLEHDPPGTIEAELFKMLAGFETSLNPYIAHNPYMQPVKNHIAKVTLDLLEEEIAVATTAGDVFGCLELLCTAQAIKSTLPLELERRVETMTRAVQTKLRKDGLELYLCMDNSVEARRVSGKSLTVKKAWREWSNQIMSARYASIAGCNQLDLTAFYRKTMDALESIQFRRSYSDYLIKIVECSAQSMTFNHRIAYQDMPYRDAADRLAAYGVSLFDRMDDEGRDDCEMAAGFLAAVYKGLGLSYNHDRNFGLITYQLLESQLPDGSWKTNPLAEDEPYSQGEYLEIMYRAAWKCVDALRPMQNDMLNPANAELALV